MRKSLVLSVGLLPMLGGCYTYRPLAGPEPLIGSRVSVQLTDDAARTLAGQIGPNVLHVEGNVLDADSTGLVLSVRQIETERGIQSDWTGERVMLPRQSVAGMQERRLSIGATGLMGGLAVVGMYALYRALGKGLFEGNPGSVSPGPQ